MINGSVELLAQAMHKVFTECMEGVRSTWNNLVLAG